MKAITYSTNKAAQDALELCNSIEPGEVAFVGEGVHKEPTEAKPYSWVFKHPTKASWALIADERAEALLGKVAQELTEDWYPTSSFEILKG